MGSNAVSSRTDELGESEVSRKGQTLPSSVLGCGLPPEGVAPIKGGSPNLRLSLFRVNLPTTNDPVKTIPQSCAQVLGF